MSIFDKLAKAFGPKAKAPSVHELERLLDEAEAAVATADARLHDLESRRIDAVTAGEEARAKHRSDLVTARDDADDAKAAVDAIRARLSEAQAAAIEKGRREEYDRAKAAQVAAADAVRARYEPAAQVLRDLARQVAEVDELVGVVNRSLPSGVEPLPTETETLCRDIAGTPRSVLGTERIKLWVGAGGAPVDADSVRSRDGEAGHVTVASGFGHHSVPVHRAEFERVRVRPWSPPRYGERLRDLVIPTLRPEALPEPQPVEELVPVLPVTAQPPIAAE